MAAVNKVAAKAGARKRTKTQLSLCGNAYKQWLKQEQLENVMELLDEEPAVGLQNFGNMCFLNAVLQCLYYNPLLRRTLVRMISNSTDDSLDEWISALLQMFEELDKARSEPMPVEATRIASLMRTASTNGEFMRGAQADAHEAYLLLLAKLLNGCLPKDTSSMSFQEREQLEQSSVIGHVFSMELQQAVRCMHCEDESKNVHSEYCLSLSCTLDMTDEQLQTLEKQFWKDKSKKKNMLSWMSKDSKDSSKDGARITPPETTISNLMQAFFQSEDIVEWRCDKCAGKGCKRRTFVDSVPNTLSINISRAHGSSFFGHVARRVLFDEEFDLTPFLSDNAAKSCNGKKCRYTLFAVVVYRFLNESGGHYVVYVRTKNAVGTQWYLLDDKSVSTATWSDVESEEDFSMLCYASELLQSPKMTDSEMKAANQEKPTANVQHTEDSQVTASKGVPIKAKQLASVKASSKAKAKAKRAAMEAGVEASAKPSAEDFPLLKSQEEEDEKMQALLGAEVDGKTQAHDEAESPADLAAVPKASSEEAVLLETAVTEHANTADEANSCDSTDQRPPLEENSLVPEYDDVPHSARIDGRTEAEMLASAKKLSPVVESSLLPVLQGDVSDHIVTGGTSIGRPRSTTVKNAGQAEQNRELSTWLFSSFACCTQPDCMHDCDGEAPTVQIQPDETADLL